MSDKKSLNEIIESRDKLMESLKDYNSQIEELNKAKSQIWKEVAQVNQSLKKLCDHDWTREPYLYSPLYCRIVV